MNDHAGYVIVDPAGSTFAPTTNGAQTCSHCLEALPFSSIVQGTARPHHVRRAVPAGKYQKVCLACAIKTGLIVQSGRPGRVAQEIERRIANVDAATTAATTATKATDKRIAALAVSGLTPAPTVQAPQGHATGAARAHSPAANNRPTERKETPMAPTTRTTTASGEPNVSPHGDIPLLGTLVTTDGTMPVATNARTGRPVRTVLLAWRDAQPAYGPRPVEYAAAYSDQAREACGAARTMWATGQWGRIDVRQIGPDGNPVWTVERYTRNALSGPAATTAPKQSAAPRKPAPAVQAPAAPAPTAPATTAPVCASESLGGPACDRPAARGMLLCGRHLNTAPPAAPARPVVAPPAPTTALPIEWAPMAAAPAAGWAPSLPSILPAPGVDAAPEPPVGILAALASIMARLSLWLSAAAARAVFARAAAPATKGTCAACGKRGATFVLPGRLCGLCIAVGATEPAPPAPAPVPVRCACGQPAVVGSAACGLCIAVGAGSPAPSAPAPAPQAPAAPPAPTAGPSDPALQTIEYDPSSGLFYVPGTGWTAEAPGYNRPRPAPAPQVAPVRAQRPVQAPAAPKPAPTTPAPEPAPPAPDSEPSYGAGRAENEAPSARVAPPVCAEPGCKRWISRGTERCKLHGGTSFNLTKGAAEAEAAEAEAAPAPPTPEPAPSPEPAPAPTASGPGSCDICGKTGLLTSTRCKRCRRAHGTGPAAPAAAPTAEQAPAAAPEPDQCRVASCTDGAVVGQTVCGKHLAIAENARRAEEARAARTARVAETTASVDVAEGSLGPLDGPAPAPAPSKPAAPKPETDLAALQAAITAEAAQAFIAAGEKTAATGAARPTVLSAARGAAAAVLSEAIRTNRIASDAAPMMVDVIAAAQATIEATARGGRLHTAPKSNPEAAAMPSPAPTVEPAPEAAAAPKSGAEARARRLARQSAEKAASKKAGKGKPQAADDPAGAIVSAGPAARAAAGAQDDAALAGEAMGAYVEAGRAAAGSRVDKMRAGRVAAEATLRTQAEDAAARLANVARENGPVAPPAPAAQMPLVEPERPAQAPEAAAPTPGRKAALCGECGQPRAACICREVTPRKPAPEAAPAPTASKRAPAAARKGKRAKAAA